MATVLHIDSSARAGSSAESRFGSHTRRLSARFVQRWRAARPCDRVVYRDVGQNPPPPGLPGFAYQAEYLSTHPMLDTVQRVVSWVAGLVSQ